MVDIVQVYNAVKDIANKEQKGFITPQVFNSFAPIAQMNIYNEMFKELVDAKRLSRQNFDPGRDKSLRKMALEDLSFYVKTVNVGQNDDQQFSFFGSNRFTKPTDLSRIISISVDSDFTVDSESGENNQNVVNCEIVYDVEKMDRILLSNLSAPTSEFPVALVTQADIEIFPASGIDTVQMRYYAKPTSFNADGSVSTQPPYFDYSEASFGGTTIELPGDASRNFMLPPHYLNEVASEILKLIGVRLRDTAVSVYSTQEEASE
jgi:hypothetical protein